MNKTLILLITLLLLTAACTGERHPNGRRRQTASLLTPRSSGNPYEVMVVCDDTIYQGYAGRALQAILDKPLLGLPQAEEQFHKSHITERHYNRLTNIFRNIIRISLGRQYTHPKMKVERDLHATPQLVITLQGPDQPTLSQYITERTRDITTLISSTEINTAANDLYYEHNVKFARQVRETFGCELYIPADLRKMKIGDNFIWASDDGLTSIQNICIYSLPYVSPQMLTRRPYTALRDKVMARNIPGAHPGSVMSTNRQYVWTKNIRVADDIAMEARGLWEMTGEAMGGPFISHSRIDTVNQRIITVEGFVYAPDKMKRTMLRRLEAALYTLQLPTPTPKKEKK